MAEETPINSKKEEPLEGLRHPNEFEELVSWISLPDVLREPKTQSELAEKFGVGQDTISEWKQRKGFWELVRKKRKEWAREKTPNVLLSLYRKILKDGGAAEVKLWFQFAENWNEKSEIKEIEDKVVSVEPTAEEQEENRKRVRRILELTEEIGRRKGLRDAGVVVPEDDEPDETSSQIVNQQNYEEPKTDGENKKS